MTRKAAGVQTPAAFLAADGCGRAADRRGKLKFSWEDETDDRNVIHTPQPFKDDTIPKRGRRHAARASRALYGSVRGRDVP